MAVKHADPAGVEVSEEEYRRFALGDPHGQWELVDGRLREKPPISAAHGDAMSELGRQLLAQLDPGEFRVRFNHARLRRSPRNYYIPDIAVLPRATVRALRERPDALDAYPDPLPLVVEIWSPSTGDYDVDTKIPAYQVRRDLEIWRLHPYERTLTVWVRQPDGSYAETAYTGGAVRLSALPEVGVDLDAVFDA
jgi:Uma2 family endonuclease